MLEGPGILLASEHDPSGNEMKYMARLLDANGKVVKLLRKGLRVAFEGVLDGQFITGHNYSHDSGGREIDKRTMCLTFNDARVIQKP